MRKLCLLMLGLLFLAAPVLAQKIIKGRVTDDKGRPLPNATVTIKGTQRATVTTEDGTYTLTLPADARTLVFTSVGMSPIEYRVGTSNEINIALNAGDQSLNEVVVTGYTSRKKSEFAGAVVRVGAKDIEQLPLASFEQMLQGQAPGVYIASGSGQPGTAARVNIRGVGSFGNVDPLYVIDGVPVEPNVFRTLNPNDFETVDVLKDAAGTGQYGSRGANGVIVITTKRGKAGKTQFSYRGQTGFAEPPAQRNITMMNTAQRLQYEEQVLGGPNGILSRTGLTGYPGWDYSPTNPRFQGLTAAQQAAGTAALDSIRQIDLNWPGVFTRNAKFKQHELNASGGGEGFNFYTSLSYFKQEGILQRSNLDRYTFRTNLDFKRDRLSVSIRTGAGFSQQSNIESEAAIALANPIAASYLELPYRRLYLPNGKVNVGTGQTAANAFDRLNNSTSLINQFKGSLAITAQFDIWGGIAFKTTNGVDYRNNNSSRFIDPNSYTGSLQLTPTGGTTGQGLYSEGNSENLQLISTTGFSFNRTFDDKHAFSAVAMLEIIRNKNRSNSFTGYGINSRLLNTPAGITAGSSANNLIPLVSGGKTLSGIYSQFVVADYTYDQRYSVSASVRKDAPSQLPIQNRDNTYWTASGSWNAGAEGFMMSQNFIQDLRIRASYGEVANINGLGSDFGYIPSYASGSYAGVTGIVPNSPGNAFYKLETQIISNVGTDFSIFDRRVRITADYYIKNSSNLFLAQEISRTTGFNSLRTNVGKMRNQGFEFDFKVDVVKTNDLTVNLGINGATLKNRILDMGQITELAAGTGISRVGLPFGTHYTVGYLGVNPQTGLPIYQNANGDSTSQYSTANSLANFGTYLPSFTGGASFDVTWKGFTISGLFHTAQGVKRFNNESFFYETTTANVQYNKSVGMLQTWQKPGDITNFQRTTAPREFSSKDIQDASFVRFRNLTASYTYTLKENKYLRSIRIWGQGQNLYTWTKWAGFDPEESNNIAQYEFPNPKTYTLGIDVNF
jgi:TonB-linked SusC/RagA family outer membrane protein